MNINIGITFLIRNVRKQHIYIRCSMEKSCVVPHYKPWLTGGHQQMPEIHFSVSDTHLVS